MSINILDSTIYNRIAAGEVIEKPRSVVKELIENSIDAGASTITLEIKDGGITLIKVTDDGCGLDEEDLQKAFLPHATSKIQSLKDLDSIITLGFRGEALASIASVAKAEMISRRKDSLMGAVITYDNGEVKDFGECGCPEGTTVKVENLFDNIPARKKFLDKPATEEREITNLMAKLILANPDISFRYISDGEIIFLSNGKGMKEAVFAVYGNEFYSGLINVENVLPEISLKGFIGRPGFSKHNRSYQSLFVNGRYVINSEISYIIQNYYSEYLMSRQFPVYILYLNLPPDMLDVNIHPNKMEVKFADFGKVKQIISQTVKKALSGNSAQPVEIIMNNIFGGKERELPKQEPTEAAAEPKEEKSAKSFADTKMTLFGGAFSDPKGKINLKESYYSPFITLEPKKQDRGISNEYKVENKPEQQVVRRELLAHGDMRIIGSAFNTYIIIEKDDNLYLIDQHAAHERYLFDKLKEQYDTQKASQQLFFPYVFEVEAEESEKVKIAIVELEKFGFVISKGNGLNFEIKAIPAVLSDLNINDFVCALIYNLRADKIPSVGELMKDALADMACKAAIKGNYDLNESEILALIDEIGELKVLQCPHGRPLMIKISKYEIEKWFKRKV